MKPLSILKFIKGSYRKVLPLAVTVALSAGLLYFLVITINHITDENMELNAVPLTNVSLINNNGGKITRAQMNSDLKKLQNTKEIRSWYFASVQTIDLKTNTSDNNMLLFLIDKKNMGTLMKFQKLHLIEGRMPQNPDEIVLHKKLAMNYGLKPGDVVTKNQKGWSINRNEMVVGILDGPAIVGFGYMEEKIILSGTYGISVVAAGEDTSMKVMNEFLEKNFGNRYDVVTIDRIREIIKEGNHNIKTMQVFIGIIILMVLCVLLGNISMIQYTQREKEFKLLYALGYTKRSIIVKTFKEIGSSALLGYIAGIGIAIAAGGLMNIYVLDEKDLGMKIVIVKDILILLGVPLIVSLTSIIAPIKLMKFDNM